MRHFQPGAMSRACVLGCIVSFSLAVTAAQAAPWQDPPTFSSQNGRLDVLMIAAQRPQVSYGGVTTNLWTYEICPLPVLNANACPAGTSYAGLGGARLAVLPGDTLHVRLVNKLRPPRPATSIISPTSRRLSATQPICTSTAPSWSRTAPSATPTVSATTCSWKFATAPTRSHPVRHIQGSTSFRTQPTTCIRSIRRIRPACIGITRTCTASRSTKSKQAWLGPSPSAA